MTFPLAVLVSGRGTNLQAILDACRSGALDARVVLVASNREGVPALDRAERAGVLHRAFTGEQLGSRADAHRAIGDAVVAAGARLVVLAGFDQILAPAFFERIGEMPVINIHPALLPAFGGKGMLGDRVHEAVLAAKVKETGVTVHRVRADAVDEGEIVLQRRVPVREDDDVASLSARVLAVEHEALVDAIRTFVAAGTAAR